MDCGRFLAHLNAYIDGELPKELRRRAEEHLAKCPACRSRVLSMHRMGEMLDAVIVPPLPQGFEARVMAEAQRRSVEKRRRKFPLGRQAIRFFMEMPARMRLAACAAVFLACIMGLFMGKDVFSPEGRRAANASRVESAEGFEWFSPTPPASLGSAYLTLASSTPEERDGP